MNSPIAREYRRHLHSLVAVALTLAMPAFAKLPIADQGQARCTIITQPGATAAERYAAEELASMLKQITGASFETRESASGAPENAIVIGPGPVAATR